MWIRVLELVGKTRNVKSQIMFLHVTACLDILETLFMHVFLYRVRFIFLSFSLLVPFYLLYIFTYLSFLLCIKLCQNLWIPAILRLAGLTANVEPLTITLFARALTYASVRHRIVTRNVWLALIVGRIKLVFIRNVKIHARACVVLTLSVKSLTIIRYAVVTTDILAILL